MLCGLQGAGCLAQAGQRRDDEVQVGAGCILQAVGQLEVGRQRDARQVAAVFTVGPHRGNVVGFTTPQDHVVAATEGQSEGGAPRSGTENGYSHGVTVPRPG